MRKEYLSIIKALSTVFFQEGFDREKKMHGLEYWNVPSNDLSEHCRQCKICGNECIQYLLNTVDIDGQWFLRVYGIEYDEYGQFTRLSIMLLIPINTERLCWEEMPKCAELIATTIFPNLNT